MESNGEHRIRSVEHLRKLYGEPHKHINFKVLKELDEHAIEYIARSPFMVLATCDADGNMDASPKGDAVGFVTVEDPRTLVIPDRSGNKLLFGLQNILSNPKVGVIFMIPHTNETLRVNGIAELTCDPEILNRLAARGTPALSAIRITVHECFIHCAKAFIRSQLWNFDAHPGRHTVSFGKMLAAKLGGGEEMVRVIDEAVEKDYKENL